MTGEAKILVGLGVVTLDIFVGGIFALIRVQTGPTVLSADPTILRREDSHAREAEDAQLTLVEFSDYQCPFCAQAHPFVEGLLEQYGDRVTFVYRHFPLATIHRHAQLSAEAAEAAGAQGKFWEMHDLIFRSQADWEGLTDALPVFQGYAEQLELDMEQFNEALESDEFLTKIQQDVADGNVAGVNGTPAFFVDGERFSGSLAGLQTLIEAKLDPAEVTNE